MQPLPPHILAALELAEEAPRDPATGELTPEGRAQVQAALDQGKKQKEETDV